MSEVRITPGVHSAAIISASSKGAVEGTTETKQTISPEPSGNKDSVELVENTQTSSPLKVREAIDSISEYVRSINRDLQFTVDEELKRTVIKVVDGNSGELIRQIPEEVFLDLARRLSENGEFQLIEALS